jgi:hypothetical protein
MLMHLRPQFNPVKEERWSWTVAVSLKGATSAKSRHGGGTGARRSAPPSRGKIEL